MGGAQPLAITMNGGVALLAESEEWRINKRLETRYLDVKASSIEEGVKMALDAKQKGQALSIGICCNAVHLLEYLIKKSSNEGDKILEPFAGGGSTLLACKNTNRKATGIEIEQNYYELIKSKI
jgi:hypothetical protein